MALKGFLAGAAISLGGLLFLIMMTYVPAPMNKVMGALVFPIGLSIVCIFKLFLFTGKIGLIFEKKQDQDYYISLPVMYVFNLVGALLCGLLCYLIFKDTSIYQKVSSISLNKTQFNTANDIVDYFVKAFLCGLCVYLAVRFFAVSKLMAVKLIAVFAFIGFFVYKGYEHCIANMYYFSFALFPNPHVLSNLAIVTLGNIVGTIPGVILFDGLNLFKK